MKQSVLIVDDEEDARELHKVHLARHKQLYVVGEATNGQEAQRLIETLMPDIVILDIHMPEINGIELVEQLESSPIVVFVTAYDAFAVKAFELNAADYLLKPFSADRFDEMVSRILAPDSKRGNYDDLLATLSQAMEGRSNHLEHLACRIGSKTYYVSTSDITMIESADQYVEVHCSGKKYLIRLSMDYLEQALNPDEFFRSHRSYLVRLAMIESVEQYEPRNYLIHMRGGEQARLSREKRELLNTKLTGI